MKTKQIMPWNVKPGMVALVPQFDGQPERFATVESVEKKSGIFTGRAFWKVTFPNGTWPTDWSIYHARLGSLPAQKITVRV